MLIGMVSGAFWFLIFLVAHVLLFHWRTIQNRFKAIARIFLLALLGHGATVLVLAQMSAADQHPQGAVAVPVAVGILVMASLFVLYMPFFFTVATSLSVQTMVIVDRNWGRVPVEDLRARFASTNLVTGRLERMVANGYLTCDQGHFRVTPKGRFVARVFGLLKHAWRLGPGG